MIKTIIVIGKPGCGKSIMVWYLSSLLTADGYEVQYLSDRLELEEAVLKDTHRASRAADGSKIGRHSKLIADGPPGHRKVHVLDGMILNRVHEKMISHLAQKGSQKVVLAEYAIGPDIDFGLGKEPLRQSARHLIGFLQKYKLTDFVFILDVEAPLAIREVREGKRPDAMALETFRAYFPDGGEMGSDDIKKLGGHYYRYYNGDEDHEGYYSEVRFLYSTYIRPKLSNSRERR